MKLALAGKYLAAGMCFGVGAVDDEGSSGEKLGGEAFGVRVAPEVRPASSSDARGDISLKSGEG
eukprot:1691539-Alexandrium_andersonii.AAC.1